MKMYFLVCYLMVILWVCYGYPMVLTANYPIIPYRIPRVFKQIIYQKTPIYLHICNFFCKFGTPLPLRGGFPPKIQPRPAVHT